MDYISNTYNTIISYLPSWLQPQTAGSYIFDFLTILVPLADFIILCYLVWSMYIFLAAVHTLYINEEDCPEQDTEANDTLTLVAVDLGIAEAILDAYNDVKEEDEIVKGDKVIWLAAKYLRAYDIKAGLFTCAIVVVIGAFFDAYLTLIALVVQGIVYSISYEYLIPLTFRHRKTLNYKVIEELR